MIQNHQWQQADFLPSPFCNDRPEDPISLIVIHSISLPQGQYGGKYIKQLFTNRIDPSENELCQELANYEVSAHLFIDRKGKITQFVPFHRRAWHAGQSEFLGRLHCNDFSIGIELEGTETDYFTLAQYQALSKITQQLIETYPIQAIVGHQTIAPQRKQDPGICFNWDYYRQLVQAPATLWQAQWDFLAALTASKHIKS